VAILGGVNPSGGFGAISGVVLGIILLQIISSGFNIIGFSAFFRNVIWGSLLLFVMVVTFFISKYQSQQKLK
ncbi:MAG: ABC transporter permease, partial [Actinobacteria bacterium]|nr:ABC transporter permease [Actinomycetota bacterium]